MPKAVSYPRPRCRKHHKRAQAAAASGAVQQKDLSRPPAWPMGSLIDASAARLACSVASKQIQRITKYAYMNQLRSDPCICKAPMV